MDIQTRKIEFVHEFLKLQSEESVLIFEQLLKSEKEKIKPMSVEELNARIDRSENDFKNERFKTTEEILNKYQILKSKLDKSVQLAQKYNLSKMSIDEITDEVKSLRNSKTNTLSV